MLDSVDKVCKITDLFVEEINCGVECFEMPLIDVPKDKDVSPGVNLVCSQSILVIWKANLCSWI